MIVQHMTWTTEDGNFDLFSPRFWRFETVLIFRSSAKSGAAMAGLAATAPTPLYWRNTRKWEGEWDRISTVYEKDTSMACSTPGLLLSNYKIMLRENHFTHTLLDPTALVTVYCMCYS